MFYMIFKIEKQLKHAADQDKVKEAVQLILVIYDLHI